MKVQQVRLPGTDRISWLVLDDDYVPVQPILSYLRFLHDLDRSPNTIRATAYHLKLFWEYLRDKHLSWTEIDVAQLAGLITWLRRQDPLLISIEHAPPRRTNATIDLSLSAVHGLYDFHIRLKTCKRYHKRGPLAIPKVSHFPQESALLEREFEQSGGKERCIPWHFEMKFAPGS
jgi:site-specific recombinase XerD